MDEGLIFSTAIISVIAVIILVTVLSTKSGIAESCVDFGKFKVGDTLYECKELPSENI